MIGVRFFEELADNSALEKRLVVVLQSWNEAARVEVDEGFGFVVWIDLEVLIGNFLFFKDGPGSLDEGTT